MTSYYHEKNSKQANVYNPHKEDIDTNKKFEIAQTINCSSYMYGFAVLSVPFLWRSFRPQFKYNFSTYFVSAVQNCFYFLYIFGAKSVSNFTNFHQNSVWEFEEYQRFIHLFNFEKAKRILPDINAVDRSKECDSGLNSLTKMRSQSTTYLGDSGESALGWDRKMNGEKF